MHITLRIAWHSNGWNGKVCIKPDENTYCIGQHSYPGDYIKMTIEDARKKNPALKVKPCLNAEGIPVCGFSMNAFGDAKPKPLSIHLPGLTKKPKPQLLTFPSLQSASGTMKECIAMM